VHLHETQSWWTLTVETNFTDLATAVETRILYKNPLGRKGFWTPNTVSGMDLVYNVQNDDIDKWGTWEIQAWAKGPDDRIALGRIERHTFIQPLL
jgi:hypothetical protein